jgi:hypothetical protein
MGMSFLSCRKVGWLIWLVGAGLFIGLTPGSSAAYPTPFNQVLGVNLDPGANFLSQADFESVEPVFHWMPSEDFGMAEEHLYALLRGQSVQEWLLFQRPGQTMFPLLALKRILRAGPDPQMGKISFALSRPEPRSSGLSFSIRDIFHPRLTQVKENIKLDISEFNPTGGGYYEPKNPWYDPATWFMEEDGLFSGRPWNWDNFLPRILTVAGLLVLGLLLTEAMRYITGLGRRMLGRR